MYSEEQYHKVLEVYEETKICNYNLLSVLELHRVINSFSHLKSPLADKNLIIQHFYINNSLAIMCCCLNRKGIVISNLFDKFKKRVKSSFPFPIGSDRRFSQSI